MLHSSDILLLFMMCNFCKWGNVIAVNINLIYGKAVIQCLEYLQVRNFLSYIAWEANELIEIQSWSTNQFYGTKIYRKDSLNISNYKREKTPTFAVKG